MNQISPFYLRDLEILDFYVPFEKRQRSRMSKILLGLLALSALVALYAAEDGALQDDQDVLDFMDEGEMRSKRK